MIIDERDVYKVEVSGYTFFVTNVRKEARGFSGDIISEGEKVIGNVIIESEDMARAELVYIRGEEDAKLSVCPLCHTLFAKYKYDTLCNTCSKIPMGYSGIQ